MLKVARYYLFTLLVLLMLAGCSTISPFELKAYEQATAIKVDALALMDKSIESYANHASAIEKLRIDVEKAYEYAKGRQKNEESTQQWIFIKSPEKKSLGGFLVKWQKDNTQSANFVNEAKGEIAKHFDQVIELESGKRKPTN
jgi:hypothetical protein